MDAERAISLSTFQQMLGDVIRSAPDLTGAWVTAELSDVRVSGGHCYMELIEKDEFSGQVIAKMRAMIWSSAYRILQRKFIAGTGNAIQSGMKVMVKGSANHHNVYGLSFIISDIDPAYTLGDIERQRREILDRLSREGVLDYNRSLAFPEVPQKIAVISAAGAAGYGDFSDHLVSSPEGFKFYPMLIPAVMQGERTAASVLEALDFVESTIDFWDCVVIIRGGGATTDMHGFDNYELARRVAEFPIPIVVGIGHERDRNVLDEIACRRCKTPTAVADFLVDCCRQSWQTVVTDVRNIVDYVTERMKGEQLRLANIENILPARVKMVAIREQNHLQTIGMGIEKIIARRFSDSQSKLNMIALRIVNAAKGDMERKRLRLNRMEDIIRLVSPENILKRGYSITRLNGHAIKDTSEIKPGDKIITTLLSGNVTSVITE